MSDTATPTTPTADPQAAPAPQPSAPTSAATPPAYTQAQVETMLADAKKQAHDAAYAQARRTFAEKPPGAPATQQQPSPSAANSGGPSGMTAQDFLRISAFTAAASEHGIPARGVELLLERVMTEKPADVRAWTATEASSFGWSKSTVTTNTNPPGAPASSVASPAAQQIVTAPATSTPSGSPPAPSAGVYEPKPSQMKPADIAAYVTQHGYKAWSARVRNELAGTYVTPPPRR